MRALLYPVIDLDAATPDELRRHARDLHHRMSALVRMLDATDAEVEQLKAALARQGTGTLLTPKANY